MVHLSGATRAAKPKIPMAQNLHSLP